MKKILLSVVVAIASTLSASAQNWFSYDVCNHLSVGIEVGSPGIGVDAATTLGTHFQLRGGITVMPSIKFSNELMAESKYLDDYYYGYYTDYVDVEAKTGFVNGKLLVDFFPSRNSSFHLTVGAYFGGSKIVEAYNKEDGALSDYRNIYIGDYLITPDDNGNINAQIKTNSFKPYVGLGFGRSVSKRKTLSFQVDMGVQFWGKPKLMCNGEQAKSSDLDDEGEFLDVISNLRVYPVINFRLSGKIF